ncbi:MAG: hypothetical protein CMJ94_02670 [Planctomycetes bacterium]|nr:hypothetical protein [Planctomycetota bacterium]
MTENQEKPVLSLGDDFEVIEEAPTPAPAAPAAAPAGGPAGVAPAPGASPFDPPFGPIRSANAWGSMGLVIAVAGLLGPWADTGGNLIHGLLLSVTVWFLVRGGFLAVQRTGATVPPALPLALLVYGVLRVALSGEMSALGWHESGGVMGVSGALMTIIGGLLGFLMPRTVAKKKDAKLPPAGAPLQLDRQFSRSLMAYLMVFFGLQMNWTDQSTGVDSMMGLVTLLFAMLMVWASWVAMWQLWQKPLVVGKLGMLLFLAPVEVFFMGIGGLILTGMGPTDQTQWLHDAYPSSEFFEQSFLAYGGGPMLVFFASCYALYLVFAGAKEAQQMVKERRAQEVEARKAARAKKKGGAPKSADKKK